MHLVLSAVSHQGQLNAKTLQDSVQDKYQSNTYHIEIGEAAANGPEDRASLHRLHLKEKAQHQFSDTAMTVMDADIDQGRSCNVQQMTLYNCKLHTLVSKVTTVSQMT